MEFGAEFPADGEASDVVEQGEGLLDDVAELADAFDVRCPLREMTGRIRRCRSASRFGLSRSPCLRAVRQAVGGAGRGDPRRAGCRRPGRGSVRRDRGGHAFRDEPCQESPSLNPTVTTEFVLTSGVDALFAP